jgi:tetratricopeptide (TPR) repeat protein
LAFGRYLPREQNTANCSGCGAGLEAAFRDSADFAPANAGEFAVGTEKEFLRTAFAAVLAFLSILALSGASADPLPTTVGPWNNYYTRPEMCVHAPDGVTSMACDMVMFSCMKESAGSVEAIEGSKEDKDRIERACWNKGMQEYLDNRNKQSHQKRSEIESDRCDATAIDNGTAIEGCTALIDADGESRSTLARAHFMRGAAYMVADDTNAAITDLKESIRLMPLQRGPYEYLEMIYFDQKRYDEIIATADEAISADPENGSAYTYRGIARYAQRQYAAAKSDFDKAIALKTPATLSGRKTKLLSLAYYGRAEVHEVKVELPAALDDYIQAVRYDPDNSAAEARRAVLQKYLKK